MVSFPPCKINLGLQVIRKRVDGYHDIATCFYPVPWTDILEIIPSDEVLFTSTGLSIPGAAESNLCLKAYDLLRKEFQLSPVKIHLHKIIPMGAGLGGGSSDAAYTLKMLNEIFQLQLTLAKLSEYASHLGSDCGFFLNTNPMLGSGRGEVLTEVSINLKNKFIVIVKPDIHVSTAEAYKNVTPYSCDVNLLEILENTSVAGWRTNLINDFEKSIFEKHGFLLEIKERLYFRGAMYAAMSGSGSSMFGIYDHETDVSKEFQTCMCWSGFL